MKLPELGRRAFLGAVTATTAASALAESSGSSATGARSPSAGHDMVQGRFGAIHYRFAKPARASRKVPLLCLHASPGSGIGYANFLSEMGKDRLTIAPDNPGFGLSDRPQDHSTIEGFAGAMNDLLHALGIDRVDLIGSHTGSATAVELTRQRPDAVGRIVLHATLMFTPQEIADYKQRLEGSVPETLDAAADRMPDLWRKFARIRSELGDAAAWQLFWEMNRDALHSGWGHDAAFAYDFAGNIRKLRQPILVLNPKEGLSPITARARGLMPNIAVTDLPWSEGLFSAHAADIAPLIRDHLDRKTTPSDR